MTEKPDQQDGDGPLPCPFCGYAAMTSGDPSDKHDPAINIHCSDCDAEGGWFRGDDCLARASKHWNTRAPTRDGAEGAGEAKRQLDRLHAYVLHHYASATTGHDRTKFERDLASIVRGLEAEIAAAPPKPVPSLDTNSVADSTGEKTGTHGASKEAGGHSRGGLTPASTLSPKPAPMKALENLLRDIEESGRLGWPVLLRKENILNGWAAVGTDELGQTARDVYSLSVPSPDGAHEIAAILNARASDYRRQGGKLFTGWAVAEDFDTDAAAIRSLASPAVAAELGAVRNLIVEACDLLAERKHGNPARSAGHNARLALEAALRLLPVQPGSGERWPKSFETAPRDGSWIIARCNDHSEMYRLRFNGEYWDCPEASTTFGDGLFLPNGDWIPDFFSRQAPHSSREGGR